MNTCEDSLTVKQAAIQSQDDGANPISSLHFKARDLTISICSLADVREFIETHHYSKNVNGVKISYCFKVEYMGNLVGGVLFGAMSTTAWKKFSNSEERVLELRRLVLLDSAGKNSESRVIGFCLRHIKRVSKQIEVIVSYADPYHNHEGIIYKASNFEYIGLSGKDKGFLDKETGKVYHSRALRTKYKGDYKPFVKKLRKKLEIGVLIPIELPQKHCFVYKYDRSKLELKQKT